MIREEILQLAPALDLSVVMPKQIHFGSASTVQYMPRGELLHWEGPRDKAIEDARAAAAAALAEPIDFPPLRRAVVPDDKVVIAVEDDVPQAAAIVAAVIEAVLQGGVSPRDVTILQAAAESPSDNKYLRAELPATYREQVQVATHNPRARGELSYLTADDHDQPIFMSRRVLDADVVVPIGCVRLDGAIGYGGARATLYPTFADQAAQDRCRAAANGSSAARTRKHSARSSSKRAGVNRSRDAAAMNGVSQDDANHVAWLMGVIFTIQVVPGAGTSVLHVLAGHLEEVLKRGRRLCHEAWSFDVPRRASLVVAAIEGDASQQNWDNVGRAIAAARRVVADNGVIALCTELAEAPGPGLRAVAEAEDLQQAQRRLDKQKAADAPAAEQWAQAMSRARLYLLSRLDEDEVEQLGAAHVASGDEIRRLIERTDSCVVLSNAQYVLPTAADD